jgi:hypothetical protein
MSGPDDSRRRLHRVGVVIRIAVDWPFQVRYKHLPVSAAALIDAGAEAPTCCPMRACDE